LKRRSFVKFAVARAACGAANASGQTPFGSARFRLSVMLWTISPKLPLSQRLEQIARDRLPPRGTGFGSLKWWSRSECREFNRNCKSLQLSINIISGNEAYESEPVQCGKPRATGLGFSLPSDWRSDSGSLAGAPDGAPRSGIKLNPCFGAHPLLRPGCDPARTRSVSCTGSLLTPG